MNTAHTDRLTADRYRLERELDQGGTATVHRPGGGAIARCVGSRG